MNAQVEAISKDVAVEEVDVIVQTAKEIGDLDKETAFDIVPSLVDSVDFSYFKLGGVLSAIQENDWWEGEANTFKEFIQAHAGLHWRKGYYLINIYDKLVESEIPWAAVSGVGWTKLKELADILTVDNVEEWVEKANSMTTLNLKEAVKAFKQGGLSTDGTTEADTSGVSTITFQVHPDQKESIKQAIDQAMEEAETEYKGVALEAICLNYLNGGSTKKQKAPSLTAMLEKAGVENVLEAFEAVFPEVNLTAEMD